MTSTWLVGGNSTQPPPHRINRTAGTDLYHAQHTGWVCRVLHTNIVPGCIIISPFLYATPWHMSCKQTRFH